jgi:hypothetical protein
LSEKDREFVEAYARAVLWLNLQMLSRGGTVPICEVEAVICEDGLTVLMTADDGHGGCVTASFMLREAVAEDDFDPTPYARTCAREGLIPETKH